MKIKNIKLNNFAKYDKVEVSFDEKVNYLVGKNGSGKSTLGITAIWFIFQGIAEKASGGNNPLIGERFRFIGPKAATAKGEMILHDEKTGVDIKVIRKLTKTGSELSFEGPEGMELNQQWLTDLFNIFLIAPKKFCELTPKEQAKALGIDTKEYDSAIAELKQEYTSINAVYKAIGNLETVEEVKEVDVTELQRKKDEVRKGLNDLYSQNKARNTEVRKKWEDAKNSIDDQVKEFNDLQIRRKNAIDYILNQKARIVAIFEEVPVLANLVDLSKLDNHIASFDKPEPLLNAVVMHPSEPYNLFDQPEGFEPAEDDLYYIKELPEDAELQAIDKEIAEASEANRKALLYSQFIQKKHDKEKKEAELKANKDKQAKKEEERLEYIRGLKFPFSNLAVGDDGELLLNGKPIKDPYFSTGELLKIIPVLISTTQPELKYVFLQDFNLLDEDMQAEIETYLTEKGFQLVVELVGKEKIADHNCILLKDNVVVENYEEAGQQLTIG